MFTPTEAGKAWSDFAISKMAVLVNKIGGISRSFVIQERLSSWRKLFPLGVSFYSTENASSASEEFSLRFLDGKREGTSTFL